ncbi:hypothetical protein LWC34_11870 [Kibdelosporangium philippinense]|uniref:NADPH-dependent reductive aminase-like C-terminal domain-containing protein n=1 Tax=Kibdelosporangium philippinense TaxID=211113 RepID=A0ABS8Z9Q0_9PSEU|nr:hypothetical protein [Kibdelosporangium philippinense]MCE7003520.1 hypothetical protein [Kibdelosporangium philippinense]
MPTLLGFLHGAAMITARDLPAETMVRFTQNWLAMIAAQLPRLAAEIDAGDCTNPTSTIALFEAGIPQELAIAKESGLDPSWQHGMHAVVQRAVDLGHRDHSMSALIEPLRQVAHPRVHHSLW